MKCRSEWHRPATLVRINTSRGPGFGRLTSSIASGLFTSCRTAAFMAFPRCLLFWSFRGARPWREPGIHDHDSGLSIPALRHEAHPGMTWEFTLGGQKQFANLGHAGDALAQQK